MKFFSHSNSQKTHETRIYGFDIIRLFCIWAIIIFHTYETLIFKDEIPQFLNHSLYSFIQHYARVLAVSGFYIVALSSFLIGYRRNQKWGSLLALAIFGFFLLAWVEADDLKEGYLFEWDIYPFLIFSWIPLYFAKKSTRAIKVLGIFGFSLLFFPFWEFIHIKNKFLQTAFFGECQSGNGSGWPLFPWMGLVWSFFSFGYFLKRNSFSALKLESLYPREKWIWAFLLLPSFTHVGAYYNVPIGPGFSCFVFRQKITDFWAHMVFLSFSMRISFLLNVREWLNKIKFIQLLSHLCWSRHFGLCYILHFFIIGLFSILGIEFFSQNPHIFDLVVLLVFPLTELLCRAVLRAQSTIQAFIR